MTKMASVPIYGKKVTTNRLMALKLGMLHYVLEFYHDYSNDDLGLALTFLNGKVKYAKMFEHMSS